MQETTIKIFLGIEPRKTKRAILLPSLQPPSLKLRGSREFTTDDFRPLVVRDQAVLGNLQRNVQGHP